MPPTAMPIENGSDRRPESAGKVNAQYDDVMAHEREAGEGEGQRLRYAAMS